MKTLNLIIKLSLTAACLTISSTDIKAAAAAAHGPQIKENSFQAILNTLAIPDYTTAIKTALFMHEEYGLGALEDLKARLANDYRITPATKQTFLDVLATEISGAKKYKLAQSNTPQENLLLKEPQKKRHAKEKLSDLGIFMKTVAGPQLQETIVETMAHDWLTRNPGISRRGILEYNRPLGFGLEFSKALHQRIQELRSQFVFFVNTSNSTMDLIIYIDPVRNNVLEHFSMESSAGVGIPRASFDDIVSIAPHSAISRPWMPAFRNTSHTALYYQNRLERYNGPDYEPDYEGIITPGDVVYINDTAGGIAINHLDGTQTLPTTAPQTAPSEEDYLQHILRDTRQ